ncbi:MAG: right-handed parallel beta-helix repeat-containing protein [Clostridia bacterium]|nr:right-handed parallel beta-helix repeat-containing protein [Clostridia bacterium]
MKAKKLLALALTLCLAFSCIAVIPFTATVASAATATASKSAVFIGKSDRSNVAANVFLPISTKYSGDGGYKLADGCFVRLTFKAKMLSGEKPIVGFVRLNTSSTSKVVQTTTWVNNSTASYDAATGNYSIDFEFDDIPGDSNTYKSQKNTGQYDMTVTRGSGGKWGALTIGNMEHNNNWHRTKDYSASFIMSDPCLQVIKQKDGTDYSDSGNMIAGFDTFNENGVYGLVDDMACGNDTQAPNNYFAAPANTWSRDTYDPALVKFVKVDNDYLTANRTYVQHGATANTREYYTCDDFGDNVKFEKLGAGCYNRISNDINKKSVVIGNDGTDKVTNIYLPLYTHRYFQSITNDGNLDLRDGYSANNGDNIFYHVSFNAKRLSGTGQPIVGRLYAKSTYTAFVESSPNAAYNNSDSTAQASPVMSSYNPSTGAFSAVVRANKGYFDQSTPTGYNEFLTIGNCEHSGSGFDASSFDSSFIISDIQISVYDTDDTTLLDSHAAPEMVAGNYSFGPSTDSVDDHSTQKIYRGNDKSGENGRPTELYKTACDTWTAEGAYQQIKAINRNNCNAACHTLVKHAATDNTREYYSCATCAKNYVDKFASAECDTIYATKKMIAVKASGSRPGNAFITIDNPGVEGIHYYMFTCDMRIFGEDLPVLSTVKGSWWGGNGAQSETSWVNNSEEATGEGLFAYYDEEARKYMAVFKVEHPNATVPFNYYNAVSGAYAALILGNGQHVGANGYTDTRYFSSFIFANPEVYELSDPTDLESIVGENICPAISDKTHDFSTAYTGQTAQQYNTENTMYKPNNILAAPVGQWHVDGSNTWVQQMDIPAETFFTEQQGFASKMLRVSGSGNNYNYCNSQAFLKADREYQFDIDYREFGSPARIELQITNTETGSFSKVLDGAPDDTHPFYFTKTAEHVDGAHYSVRFTMPSTVGVTGDGNFRVYLGQSTPQGSNKNINSVHFANAKLRPVDNGELGGNLLMNGSFDFGEVGDITQENIATTLFGWGRETVNNTITILSFVKHQLMDIPAGFFTGNDLGNNNRAIKFNAKDWAYIRTGVELEPSTTYELSYNYRATDDDITLGVSTYGNNAGSYTLTPIETQTKNGKFAKVYRITTSADTTPGSGNNPNTLLEFRCPASADGNAYYIGNFQFHKVVNNAIVGANILGDRNAIYNDSYYPSTENAFTLANNDFLTSQWNDLGHAWISTKANTTGAVVNVNDKFFNYYTPAQRLAAFKDVLLGRAAADNLYTDSTNMYYNPDKTGAYNTLLDFVKVRNNIVNIADIGGAGTDANLLKDQIMYSENVDTTGASKVIYVDPASGNDSAAGTSESTALKTISKANGKASSGNYVLVKRGTTTRIGTGESGIPTKSGINYGTYGTGDKPLFIGSQKNYNTSFTSQGNNIWVATLPKSGDYHDGNTPGNVYFFTGANDMTPSMIGRIIKPNNQRFASTAELEKNGDVYYNTSSMDGKVYIYSTVNPNTYGKIEIGEKRSLVTLTSNVTIDGWALRFTGGHGMAGAGISNVTIKNCEVAYVGGTPNGSETMGNGIQFGNGGSNLNVENCYVYQCYDAGITFQSYGNVNTTFDNVNFVNNLLTNNFYNIEFFTTATSANKQGSTQTYDGVMKNITISGNIMRFAGECWSYEQRNDTKYRASNICASQNAYYVNTSNFVITNNIFDCTMCQQVFWQWGGLDAHKDKTTHVGLTITKNTYYQKAGSLDGNVNRFGNVTNDHYDRAGSTQTLRAAMTLMDTQPTKVEWVNRSDKF